MELSDIFFAYHAFLLVCITGIQCFIYPVKFQNLIQRGNNEIGIPVLVLNLAMWVTCGLLFILDNVKIEVYLGS